MPSFLDELKAVRSQVVAQAEKTLEVPGSGGRQAVRFRPPTDLDARDRLTGVVAAYRVGGALSAAQEKQLLVDCCDAVLIRGDDGELQDPDGGPRLVFDASDERWGDDVNNAHDCVSKLYNLDVQPLAAAGQADVLIDWLQGLDAEIQARAEGNSASPAAASS